MIRKYIIMAARTRTVRNRTEYESTYVYGNTVRKSSALPRKREEKRTYVGTKRVRVSPTTYRNREKALRMNGAYVTFLAIVSVISLLACVYYLKLQAEITQKSGNITSLEKKIDTLKSQNDSLDYAINSYIDSEYIYKVATEELGMVLATEEQVSIYKSSESEYMKQYANIP